MHRRNPMPTYVPILAPRAGKECTGKSVSVSKELQMFPVDGFLVPSIGSNPTWPISRRLEPMPPGGDSWWFFQASSCSSRRKDFVLRLVTYNRWMVWYQRSKVNQSIRVCLFFTLDKNIVCISSLPFLLPWIRSAIYLSCLLSSSQYSVE